MMQARKRASIVFFVLEQYREGSSHMSRVTCHVSLFFFFLFSDKVVKLICGGSVINGAYPV